MLAIATPQAAIDDAGMQYTSAAEGFYGSLRLELNQQENDGAESEDFTGLFQRLSRLGVKGSVDLGRGLTATYHYEFNVNANDGVPVGTTRLHNVGLEGGFGTLLIGTQWTVDYNYVWGNTDIMNYRSGTFVAFPGLSFRQSNVISYASPDFGGLNFAVGLSLDPQPTTIQCAVVSVDSTTFPWSLMLDPNNCPLAEAGVADADGLVFPDQNQEAATIDRVAVGVGYSVGGLDVGATYTSEKIPSGQAFVFRLTDGATLPALYGVPALLPLLPPAGTAPSLPAGPVTYLSYYDDDLETQSWGASLGYGKNNWALDYHFGIAREYYRRGLGTNTNKIHSLAGQLQIDKVTLRALREQVKLDFGNIGGELERKANTLGAQYDLGIKSRIYFEYYFDETEGSGARQIVQQSRDITGWSLGYRVDF